MIVVLSGIFLGALLFSALLWVLYRAVVARGWLRINSFALSFATITGMAGLTYSAPILVMIAAPICLFSGFVQMITDPGWSKLFAIVHIGFGFMLFNILLFTGA